MLKKRKQQTEPRRRRRTGDVYLEAVPSWANMGLTTVPVGEPDPKRTLRGTLVGAEGLTSRSTPFAVPSKLAFGVALPAHRFTYTKCRWTAHKGIF